MELHVPILTSVVQILTLVTLMPLVLTQLVPTHVPVTLAILVRKLS